MSITVDVIAHAASVRRGIVEAENIELRDGSQGRVQPPWESVRFFAMGLSPRATLAPAALK